jgi:hypothetical protein
VARNELRPLGKVTGDMEKLLLEMVDGHDMQWHEILGLVHAYLVVHAPDQQETYTSDGSHPIYFYGPKEKLK